MMVGIDSKPKTVSELYKWSLDHHDEAKTISFAFPLSLYNGELRGDGASDEDIVHLLDIIALVYYSLDICDQDELTYQCVQLCSTKKPSEITTDDLKSAYINSDTTR
jgi:hypothetical protein